MYKNKKKITIVLALFCMCLMALSVKDNRNLKRIHLIQRVTASEINVTDIDLGDYQKEMTVGDTQMLSITLIPLGSEDDITYSSSNSVVATVNELGQVTALSMGTTTITEECGNVNASFDLNVKEESIIKATELDMAECPKEIVVGESQVLGITVIPTNATNQTLTYSSSDSSVASVNAIGRLVGNRLGSAVITVNCGVISSSFTIKVVKELSEKRIVATNIEFGDYE